MELSASPCLLVGFSLLSSQQNLLHFFLCCLHFWSFQTHQALQLFIHGIASLFQVHGFVFIAMYRMSSSPLVWVCRVMTSPGLLPLGCLQIESFSRCCLLLLLNRFSRVRLCVTPQTAAHQAPPSLGFSRQEHWSGLPFPSPMHESEKGK